MTNFDKVKNMSIPEYLEYIEKLQSHPLYDHINKVAYYKGTSSNLLDYVDDREPVTVSLDDIVRDGWRIGTDKKFGQDYSLVWFPDTEQLWNCPSSKVYLAYVD